MHVITQSCVLFLWMYMLTFVKSQECTLEQFLKGPLFDSNFDTTDLDARYSGGKQVRVSCNVGFTGFFKLICVEGKWQSRGTRCQPKSCGHPGDAQFADFHLEKGDDFVFGSQVVYTCHKGYQMVSRTNYRRCMAEGWDGVVPVCEAQQCPVIHVDNNVQVNGDPEEATYGNVVRFSCKSKSEILSGSPEMYCDENGEWSGQIPKCQAITCTVPNIENGYVPGNIQEYKEHEVLHYECNAGYKRAEERPSKCIKLGIRAEWSPTPACEEIKCKLTLPPVEGTRYEPTHRNLFSPGDTLRVICGEKYWISTSQDASAVTTCKDNGEWTIRPVCQEVRCSNQRPQHVQSWQVNWWQRIGLGDTVSYWCRDGYRRTGGATWATCTRGGWNPDPLCQEITCDRQDVPNAKIITNYKQTYKNYERASYECEEGYRGRFTLTCVERGWHGNAQCTEITCDRREYRNTEIVGSSKYKYRFNDQVQYICKNGHEGSFNMTCKETGWIGSPDCTKRQCKKLNIDHAYITRNEKETYSHNERVQYACTHERGKVFTTTCEQSVWTGAQKCAACPTPEVRHGFAVGPYNGTVYYTCDEGYKLFSKGWWAEAKCNDGEWSGFELCIENEKCGKIPVIPNANVTSPSREDQSYRITCKEGYTAQVEHFTCRQGKWHFGGYSHKTICTPNANLCSPPPKVANAVVVTPYQRDFLPESTVMYTCRNKYTLIDGENTIRCIDGKWETKDIKCTVKPCELPDDTPNGYYQIIRGEEFVFGTTIKYFCDEGYQMVSKVDTRTCLLDKWTNHVPTCEPLSCDPPPADIGVIVKGIPENDNPILPDRFLTFSCDDPGKYLNGSSVLICGRDGQWDNPLPSCEDITCEAGVMPPHLNVAGLPPANETMKIGHKLQFSCKDQYTMEGSAESECLQTGQWSVTFPTCSENCKVTGVSGSVLFSPRVRVNQIKSKGEKLTFRCRRRGDFLQGKAVVTCLADGQWSDPFPTCGAPLGCGRPPSLLDGDIKTSLQFQYRHNDWVEYICQSYYTMEGRPYKTCINGEWTGQMRCLKPCTVDRDAMNAHNIAFRYTYDDKLYSAHNDEIEFMCKRGRTLVGRYGLRQKCVDGVIHLPTCQ
ncbi:complement factor H-like isoform X17 [Epinephelus fuscoguttatus]|uniref:complement factor H-like isoform X17 n=1 Tax=Epinephelus fuscoguttatus TaxID=293821 RepID=UPI0020D1C70E|nr:complement factor H-like isoform X17 [Epinephelus fuscoguttatus]